MFTFIAKAALTLAATGAVTLAGVNDSTDTDLSLNSSARGGVNATAEGYDYLGATPYMDYAIYGDSNVDIQSETDAGLKTESEGNVDIQHDTDTHVDLSLDSNISVQ